MLGRHHPGSLVVVSALAILSLLACASPADLRENDLTVYAAVSLREPLLQAKERLEREAGAPVVFNFGASNDLARQIVAARRADVFLSADEIQMDLVERAGLIEPGTRRRILSNSLVIVVPRGKGPPLVEGPEDLAGPQVALLSMADPSGVPAGRYAKEWLEAAGLWEQVRGRIAPAIDARAALAAVESGGAQAGIVYRTDAALSRRVKVVYEIPAADGPAIAYTAAVLRGASPTESAGTLLGFLAGAGAEEIFGRYGFIVRRP
jgi:molybdate transport system substrate-binding protein